MIMPAKSKYSEDDIVNAAFRVVRKNGWESCTARSIANELGSSTMPIYSYLKSMDDLKHRIVRKGLDLMLQYQTTAQTDIVFLDMGLGYVLFAKQEKNLFKLMFHDIRETNSNKIPESSSAAFKPFHRHALDALADRLADTNSLEGFTREEKEKILYKAWIFSHGLAVLANNERIDPDTEEIVALLKETGKCLIEGAKIMKEKEKKNE